MGTLTDRVTIVVIARDKGQEPLRALDHALALDEKPRVVVIGKADAAGRNAAARSAVTPYVAFCDEEAWWAPGALSRAAELLDSFPRLALVTARVLIGPQRQEAAACRRMGESPLSPLEHPGRPVVSFLPGAVMLRRSAFLQVGGFHQRFFLADEEALLSVDLLSAGWQLCYVPDIIVSHHPEKIPDARSRKRLLERNALWLAWLRRPPASALSRTWTAFRRGLREPETALALLDALRGLPWILGERQVVPARVEEALRLVERSAGR